MKITIQQMDKILELCEADPQAAYLGWLRYADPKEQLKDALKNYIREQTKMACLGERYVKMPDEDSEVIASYCYRGGPLTNEKIATKFLGFVGRYVGKCFAKKLCLDLDDWGSGKKIYDRKPWYLRMFCVCPPMPDENVIWIDIEELCELYYDFFAAKDIMIQEALECARSVLKEKARQMNRQYLNIKGVHLE